MRTFVFTFGVGLLSACSPRLGGDGSSRGSDDSTDAGEEHGDSSVTLGTGVTATDEDSGDDDDDDGDDCGGFLGCEDVTPLEMCDFWAQSCPPSEKCTALASTPGSGTWDANVCVPFGTDGVGQFCTLADGPPGTDTCDAVSLCYDIDPQTGVGVCIGLCQGPEAMPTCPSGAGPHAQCKQTSSGVLNICLGSCNPLLPGECGTGQNCVAAFEGQDLSGFICFPPAAEGLSGEECDCANCCAAHHMCVTAADYGPDCAFDLCCTQYCDSEDATFVCDGTDQVCVALFDPNTPEFGNVGRCVVP